MVRNIRSSIGSLVRKEELPLSALPEKKKTVKELFMPYFERSKSSHPRLYAEASEIHDFCGKAIELGRAGAKSVPIRSTLGRLRDSKSDKVYAEDTPLTEIFGNHRETKIVAALLSEKRQAITSQEVARLAGVRKKTADEHLKNLKRLDIVEIHCQSCEDEKYKLDIDDDTVKDLWDIERRILQTRLKKDLQ